MADGIQINDQMCAKIRNKAGDNRNLAFKKEKGSEREPKRFTPCSTSLMALGALISLIVSVHVVYEQEIKNFVESKGVD